MGAKQVLTLADLGHEEAWLLVQQACGIPDARSRSSFLENMTFVLLFAKEAFPERLCMTAAVRQMGGHVVYVAQGSWEHEIAQFPNEIAHITEYYMDCAVCYGLPTAAFKVARENRHIPLVNGGGPDAHPVHALADVACMQQYIGDLSQVRAAWIGRANGTLNSLIEAMEYFPFSLTIATPEEGKPDPARIQKAQQAGCKITVTDTPEEAVKNANIICAGRRSEDANRQDPLNVWCLNPRLLGMAAQGARILLTASPLQSTPIDNALLRSEVSLLYKQAENRLRVNKRLIHWLFNEN